MAKSDLEALRVRVREGLVRIKKENTLTTMEYQSEVSHATISRVINNNTSVKEKSLIKLEVLIDYYNSFDFVDTTGKSYWDGHKKGYTEGKEDGSNGKDLLENFRKGWEDGYDECREDCKDDYDDGYNDGHDSGFEVGKNNVEDSIIFKTVNNERNRLRVEVAELNVKIAEVKLNNVLLNEDMEKLIAEEEFNSNAKLFVKKEEFDEEDIPF